MSTLLISGPGFRVHTQSRHTNTARCGTSCSTVTNPADDKPSEQLLQTAADQDRMTGVPQTVGFHVSGSSIIKCVCSDTHTGDGRSGRSNWLQMKIHLGRVMVCSAEPVQRYLSLTLASSWVNSSDTPLTLSNKLCVLTKACDWLSSVPRLQKVFSWPAS